MYNGKAAYSPKGQGRTMYHINKSRGLHTSNGSPEKVVRVGSVSTENLRVVRAQEQKYDSGSYRWKDSDKNRGLLVSRLVPISIALIAESKPGVRYVAS